MGGGGSWESEEEKGPVYQQVVDTCMCVHPTPDNNSAIPLAWQWRTAEWGEKEKEPEVIIVATYGRTHGQAEDMNHSFPTQLAKLAQTQDRTQVTQHEHEDIRERDVSLLLLRAGNLINFCLALLNSSPLVTAKDASEGTTTLNAILTKKQSLVN